MTFRNLHFAILTFVATGLAPLHAQMHKVTAPETVTRAVAVYEWTGDLAKPTAERLVPVSLFIDGEYQDAGTYYARPVPLALLNGNVYSLEKAGQPQGNVTIDYARHLQTATSGGADTSDLGWFGYGNFAALPPPPKEKPLKASATLSAVIGSKGDSSEGSDRPTFAHKPSTTDSTAAKNPTAAPSSPSAPDDPDRPHLGKTPETPNANPAPDPADASATTTSPPQKPASDTTVAAPSKDPASDPDRPTLRHRDPRQAEADRKARQDKSGVIAAPGSLNTDPDRPTMRRGKPADAETAAPQMTGLPADLHQEVAVSDAATREPHVFAREWASPDEQADIQKQLAALARKTVRQYARTNALKFAPEPAPHDHKSNRKGLPKAASEPEDDKLGLENQQLSAYTLSYGGLPTFVYSAAGTSVGMGAEIYVTVVAQKLASGELQVALTAVTDSIHLDRSPWFRFVDAVDPDAGHRASLLFELRSQNTRQFALYRVLSANAEQIFVTHTAD